MAFTLKTTLTNSRCAVASVILLLALLVYITPATAQLFHKRHRSCHNGTKVCVTHEQCHNKSLNLIGVGIIAIRTLDPDEFDECNEFGMECCGIPLNMGDSGETEPVTTTTTEEPEDHENWSAQCGQRTDFTEIDNDNHESSRYEYPWNVALFSVSTIFGKKRNEFICGGTLIDDYLVLTAAGCVHQKNRGSLVVQLGRWDLDQSKEPKTQEIAVEELIIHPGFVSSSKNHNIALLYLKDAVNMGRAANRVCLPESHSLFDADSLCYVYGWTNRPNLDHPNRQLKIRSTFADEKECAATIRRATGTTNFQLLKENICPNYLDDPVPCERAYGSGMVCESKTSPGQFYLAGFASFSIRNCDKFKAHDAFVKVSDYIKWIDEKVLKKERQTSFYRPDPSSFETS